MTQEHHGWKVGDIYEYARKKYKITRFNSIGACAVGLDDGDEKVFTYGRLADNPKSQACPNPEAIMQRAQTLLEYFEVGPENTFTDAQIRTLRFVLGKPNPPRGE